MAASMSGSGGSVFGIFADVEAAERVAALMRLKAPEAQVFVAKTLDGLSAAQD